jgi:signal transduction histidine kinase
VHTDPFRPRMPLTPQLSSTAMAAAPGDGATVETEKMNGAASALDHLVQFYETDEFLVDTVSEYLSFALHSGHSSIVVATESHCSKIEDRLRSAGLDVDAARKSGRFLDLEAESALELFMVDGTPDPERFRDVFGPIIDQASVRDRQVRIFGEMVAILAMNGDYDSALKLESLWNDLRRDHEFSLLCAYPLNRLSTAGFADVLAEVCLGHDHVIPAESFMELHTADQRNAEIAQLQQKARWLEVEVAWRQRLQTQLQDALAAESAARAQAEQALSLRDDFLSIAAHELKTPLTSLSGHAQLLLRWLDGDAPQDSDRLIRSLRNITVQSDKLSRLITQLLDISRLEEGQLNLDPTPVDLVTLVTGIVESARSWSDRHAISVDAPESLLSHVDSLRLEQVVTNLLDNAIKYSPDGGRVDVALRTLDTGTIELSVRDQGIGIPSEKRDQIFQRFYQAHDGGHRSGMGIGLFVSQQIIELHGGAIHVEFPPDGGTCFIIHLPASA